MQSQTFLIVDFHAESRFLLARTLLRKFPGAEIVELEEADDAIDFLRRHLVSAIVTHRTFDVEGAELVRRFRDVDRRVPIVMVSGIDREQSAIAAGATCFLHYDEWLLVGTVVESLLMGTHRAEPAGGSSDLSDDQSPA